MGVALIMGVLKCTTMDSGVQCVMTDGMYLERRLKLFVENWDFPGMIVIGSLGNCHLGLEKDQSGWTK